VAVADVNGDGRPDLVTGIYSGSVSVLLGNRNAATHFLVSAPGSATAGTPFTITVTALTAGNQLDALYSGTVQFTSSDGSAGLPADYTFTLADAGSHTFSVTLNTAGSQTITATDQTTSSLTGSAVVTVTKAAAPTPPPPRGSHRGDIAGVAVTAATTPFRMTVPPSATTGAALALFGDVGLGGRGSVALTRSDGTATVLMDDRIVHPDAGTHPFQAVSTTDGSPTITATDTATGSMGTTTVMVNARGLAARDGQLFDPDGDVLNPAGITAFFILHGLPT
jgi:hypothetical protein